MIDIMISIVFFSVFAVALYGAVLLVCDKQRDWEKRHGKSRK
jgi:hypothetical protein